MSLRGVSWGGVSCSGVSCDRLGGRGLAGRCGLLSRRAGGAGASRRATGWRALRARGSGRRLRRG
ncbi:MAG: hypothetical protein B7Y95_15085, partial [Rhizobiales bacterium 32-66-11]